jgi:DedD protein
MRNTSEAAMDDRGLRDIERWKDKIEVRLDNRQVFFLFFGSALVACLLFILGVIVGKRLESRGRAMAPELEDPLALLDKVATAPRSTSVVSGPALPKALLGTPAPVARPGASTAKAAPAPVTVAKAAPSPVGPAKSSAPAATSTEARPAAVKLAPPPAKPAQQPAKPAAPTAKALALAPKSDPAPPPAVPSAAKKAVAAPSIIAPAAANTNAATKTKGRFTLQLGAFPDRAEAEAFAKRFAAQSSYVVPSEIPGKGTWFRVRVGDYATAKDAIAAKSNFEKQHGVIAYVVGPR